MSGGLTTRVLPPDEWPRLAGTLLDTVWPTLPAHAHVMAVEDAGRIVACAALVPLWHLECAWVAPSHRRRIAVWRRFHRLVGAVLRRMDVHEAWMMATDDAGRRFCEQLGPATHLACDHYAVNVERLWV